MRRLSTDITAKAVLLGMRSYIGAFFRCSECRVHFLRHSAHLESEVDSDHGPSGVTWLWRIHNKVNNRLHGDPTEDARHPKVQFPTYGSCSSCHKHEPANNFDREMAWSEPEVLDYLRDFYGENHVIDTSHTGDMSASFVSVVSRWSILFCVLCYLQGLL